MKPFVKKVMFKALANKYILPLSHLFSPIYSGIGSIIMFHRVVPNESDIICDDIEITTNFLEETILFYLKANYKIVSLDEAYDIMHENNKKHQKFVVFTFDDGYIDNYTLAYPVFRKYNIPFTIYVTTSFPDKTAKLWWYGLRELVEKESHITFKFEGADVNFFTKTSDEKKQAYFEIRKLILSVDEACLDNLFERVFRHHDIALESYVNRLAMSWDQIKELAMDPIVTIGAHTVNHFNLRNLEIESLEEEVMVSKNRIESLIKKDVNHFAYPFGSKNEAGNREFTVIKEIGFKTATTTRCSNLFPSHKLSPHILPRLTISPYTETPFIEHYRSGLIPAIKNKFKRRITK